MRNTVLIFWLAWVIGLVGCEPKPVYKKKHADYVNMYCYYSWCAHRLQEHFDDSLQFRKAMVSNIQWTKERDSAERGQWIEFVEDCVVILDKHGDPDSSLNINGATRHALMLADSVARAEQPYKAGYDLRLSALAKQVTIAIDGLDTLLRQYRLEHNIVDSEVVKALEGKH